MPWKSEYVIRFEDGSEITISSEGTSQANTLQVGNDPSYADPRGRAYYAFVSHTFE